jgi:hypothetical protein
MQGYGRLVFTVRVIPVVCEKLFFLAVRLLYGTHFLNLGIFLQKFCSAHVHHQMGSVD